MKGNIPYFDCYHVTRSGDVYSKYKYFNERGVIWKKVKR